ncbi:AGAP013459-PA [Anopheles gambiae str. PEST]|uniref:AGAP013459-PA n=1 Tax=Anopheles gambiae TaxID=7165 RepID=F5HK82_ANOGA|nr:AGAP013459-PA [Anopheles gambiae str. PEST]
MAASGLCRKNKDAFLVVCVLWLSCITSKALVVEAGEGCEWQYACCEWVQVNGSCKSLCPKPTIVCPAEETSTSDPVRIHSPKVIVTAPCNEGYRRDHTQRCRKIFEDLVYF